MGMYGRMYFHIEKRKHIQLRSAQFLARRFESSSTPHTSSAMNCIQAYRNADTMKKMIPPVKHAKVKR